MGRKKYFCDFCCRYFNDDKNMRLKHLNSVAHTKAKAEHYDMFKDPEVILRENSVKKPCRRFQMEGFCQFGSSCIYTHYSPYELDLLRREVERAKMEKERMMDVPSSEAFKRKCEEILKRKSPGGNKSVWSHELAGGLLGLGEALPISLQPFNVKIYEDLELDEWG